MLDKLTERDQFVYIIFMQVFLGLTDSYFLKNFLLYSVTLPEPSTCMTYWSNLSLDFDQIGHNSFNFSKPACPLLFLAVQVVNQFPGFDQTISVVRHTVLTSWATVKEFSFRLHMTCPNQANLLFLTTSVNGAYYIFTSVLIFMFLIIYCILTKNIP